ncbi:MAG: DEAD/DEAH box helicase [Alicyclobacillus macrosporangiidus]|uniref:DEAD/DEAH box helicase n=1 Tax=Alicyclobacillus macrosporangiidus TaxID=392015 RepID=UPI0026ED35A4|nr:DEAD/DEAH box helicase [Alicyclobacillus macrosporangiidus]MCL6599265.1 DEAD/DEAH box helicase [Alicyclobacillus macrosporangiidus]
MRQDSRYVTACSEAYLQGHHTCLSTGTSSGKTLAFIVSAMQVLSQEPDAKVIALYPMKALGNEQEDRWRSALKSAGLPHSVGRIDGDTKTNERPGILSRSSVLVMTPDVLHAWLLSHVGEPAVRQFLRRLRLVIVDEVHTYTGVFGSNAAFLFRRLFHVTRRLGGRYRYFCASATMRDPDQHLASLFGVSFRIVGQDLDSSPRHELTIHLVEPPTGTDLLTAVAELLRTLSHTYRRFIAFTDSRKQTEHIASILAREGGSEDEGSASVRRILGTLDILPYRSGYEDLDRAVIQQRLTTGGLKGVVSTSALELGLDIPDVDAGVLIGMPYSQTSFLQRIGRVGRHQAGTIFVVRSGSVLDDMVFQKPELLMTRPLSESALYLENRQLQYIHAMCLARPGGEHDAASGLDADPGSTEGEVTLCEELLWPDGFRTMCRDERTGEISVEFQTLKHMAGDRPNATFPLRDVELQFRVEIPYGPDMQRLGSLSYSQVMREAYPGAVYYYATKPHRIVKVDPVSHTITARSEKRYTTSPIRMPTRIYPNFSAGNVFSGNQYADLVVAECRLQLQDAVVGYKERRGRNETDVQYPLPLSANIYFRQRMFSRVYFSSGVILTHPVLQRLAAPQLDALAELVYESFLITIPFERRDIGFGYDRHRREHPNMNVQADSRFISVFDLTYGSLRLSGRLAEPQILARVLEQAGEVLRGGEWSFKPELRSVIDTFLEAVHAEPARLAWDEAAATLETTDDEVVVIRPGSVGLALRRNNERVTIERVFYHPVKGLSYRVRYEEGTPGAPPNLDVIWSVQEIAPLEGESELARYSVNTGELI